MKKIILYLREYFIENICFKNRKKVKNMKTFIKKNINKKIKNKEIWDKSFSKYINIGSETALDICERFYNLELRRIKKVNVDLNSEDPILICIIKNDMLRAKMIINYYRKMGIKLFSFLDDRSTDGTKDYLLEQEDVELFESNLSYTTNIRQAWINRIIDYYGFNRWYLIVDSDELFSYSNMEGIKISEYIKKLKERNRCTVKSILLDMYSKKGIFECDIINSNEIENEYKYFDNDYRYKDNVKGRFIYGGFRKRIFSDEKNNFNVTISKIPLLYMKEEMIIINSHCIFPYYYNFENAKSVLRHYKFLNYDINKYIERVRVGNFADGSKEYKRYIEIIDKKEKITMYNNNSIEWHDSNSINDILNNIKG